MSDYPAIAAVDLGSNSFHLVVAREVDGQMQLLHREKQRVFLAMGLDEDDNLSLEAIERGIAVLQQFAATLQGFPAENVKVVATYTLRKTKNIQQFLSLAAKVFPYRIEVISGQEEARLIYQGVARHLHDAHHRLVVDIGGGSTELIIGKHQQHSLLASRNCGCVTLTQRYFADDKLTEKRLSKAIIAAEQELENISGKYCQHGWQICYGTSGTIKAISAICQDRWQDPLITLERLNSIKADLATANSLSELQVKGITPDRVTSLPGGLAVLIAVFNQLQLKEMHYCDFALREGLLHDMQQSYYDVDIRANTINTLSERYAVDTTHASNICDSIQQLAAQVSELWQLGKMDIKLLKWAAQLHEVGLSINSSALHKHSAYIVSNTQLPGFTQEQQQLLSSLIRFYRKKLKINEMPFFLTLSNHHFFRLLLVFRLAVLLNQKRQPELRPAVQLHPTEQSLTIQFEDPEWLEQHTLFAADLDREANYWRSINFHLQFN
ncbi:exopolyphosphatase [Pseudoalteromonas xiamenensis]|uniref:exopolyphosphatase n=1 Tax=Pseudoalteromonas xiamenensis TaxID=882626 RepID=UPI0027E5AA09|nr:exopolyphosphatase [Pseudoalteromonas xiamenensis]WMN58357.1 exopolyphosphatase [Pseudoalteromonas xiamenensis]